MKRNLSELEQRMLLILRKNSRKNISEMAKELGISRITAKKIFDSLSGSGRIKEFTVRLDSEESDLAIIHVPSIGKCAENRILHDFALIDGSHLLAIYYEDLMKITDTPLLDVKIARTHSMHGVLGRQEHMHCDLCGNEIANYPIQVELEGRTFYACCPNCEKDIKKGKLAAK